MPQELPDLGTRLATIKDIPRLTIVAVAALIETKIFSWERPHFDEFPCDTFRYVRNVIANDIRDPTKIVRVVEDRPSLSDSKQFTMWILKRKKPKDLVFIYPMSKHKHIIVGMATYKLQPQSGREGSNMDEEDKKSKSPKLFDPGEGNDMDKDRVKVLNDAREAIAKKYFRGCQQITELIVHPSCLAHDRHVKTLVEWGKMLAEADKVKQGVITDRSMSGLYRTLNYKEVSDKELENEENPFKAFNFTALIYESGS